MCKYVYTQCRVLVSLKVVLEQCHIQQNAFLYFKTNAKGTVIDYIIFYFFSFKTKKKGKVSRKVSGQLWVCTSGSKSNLATPNFQFSQGQNWFYATFFLLFPHFVRTLNHLKKKSRSFISGKAFKLVSWENNVFYMVLCVEFRSSTMSCMSDKETLLWNYSRPRRVNQGGHLVMLVIRLLS